LLGKAFGMQRIKLPQREPAHANGCAVRRYCRALGEFRFANVPDTANQLCLPGCVQALDPQKYNGGMIGSGQREMRVKVVIKRDTNAPLLSRRVKNFRVLGSIEIEFVDMDSVPSLRTEDFCCVWR
jgi:hypothetical protein